MTHAAMKTVSALCTVLGIVLAACSGDGGRTLASCEAGECECVFSRECPEPLVCVDGLCRGAAVLEDTAGDARDAEVDTGDGADDGEPGDTVPVDTGPGDTGPVDSTDDTIEVGPEVIAPRPFGALCSTNTECESGYCLDSPTGGICTRKCDDGCPEDWVCKTIETATDPISLCAEDDSRLCLPCEGDRACGAAGRHLCLDIGGGRFCGRDCTDDPCPGGYRCETIALPAGVHRQCVPDNGTCDCTDASAGREKACTAENADGVCFGRATCDPDIGFVGCTARVPTPEVCNGSDDDCDGTTDEGQAANECVRENGVGRCVGVETCQGGLGRVCSAAEPAAETCDDRDDDCDGETDEDFRLGGTSPRTVEHCGACGNDCTTYFAHAAEVACDASGEVQVCALVRCAPGYIVFGGTCVAEDATLCAPCAGDDDCFGSGSRCLGLSETDPRTFCGRDCSGDGETSRECPAGYTCDPAILQCLPDTASCDCTASNEGQLKACTRGDALATCFGLERCDATLGWVECSAAVPAPEVCNGLDDDCDGSVDEAIALGDACANENGLGRCAGVTVCAGAAGVVCTASTPATEACNGRDDDCDGTTDEGFAHDLGGAVVYDVSVDHCGACNYACPDIAHGTPRCDGSASTPRCVAASCDEGYYPLAGAPTCLPVPRTNQCAPCTRDADCQGPGDRCVADGATRVCARDCGAGAIYGTAATACSGATGVRGCCPVDHVCTAEGAARVCRPRSGTCACTVEGATVACESHNDLGTCLGVRTCSLASGLGACDADTPGVELCNDLDDDCDGLVDGADGSLDVSTTPSGSAACGQGACVGQWRCIDGAWDCSARQPAGEVCDTVDNDCDGQTDETFKDAQGRYTDDDHCGGCGIACDALVANATATTCALADGAPECRATACAAGTYLFDGGRACLPLPDNLCLPCQDDADCLVPGSRCLGAGADRYCARSCAAGSPYGVACPLGYVCSGGGDAQCVPVSGSCQCGPDTLGVTRACTDDTCAGLQTCEEAGGAYAFSPCDAEGVIPEVCDGDDNDCDGTIDEGFVDGAGDYTLDIACGGCGNNCLQRWSAAQHAIGECSGGASPTCVIGQCTSGGGVEYVDTNGLPGDGCECQRAIGVTVDEPDIDFGGARPGPEAVYVDADCDGLDGDLDDALFVRAGAAAPHLGTLASPFATLTQALGAAGGKRDILVAGGEYRENIVLVAGVRLHGGYAPDFRRRNIVTFETRIVGVEPDFSQTSPLPGVVYAAGITGARTIVSGFTIVGYDVTTLPATGAGGFSSYAVYVVDSGAALELRNNRIVGGRGGPGGAGASGTNGFGRGGPGGTALDGQAGTSVEAGNGACTGTTCSGGTRAGGAGGVNASCSGANGIAGGTAQCPVYNGPSWTPPIAGKDGAPGYAWTRDAASANDSCTGHLTEAGYPTAIKKLDGLDGAPGAPGGEGLQGLGCGDGEGVVIGGQWSNVSGGTGAGGDYGARGGAGAPSGGVDTAAAANMPPGVGAHPTYRHKLGAGGGGAGAGGCGGAGGAGGGSGGASLAVFIGWTAAGPSAPLFVGNLIERGLGGDGGPGGYGGAGGVGGNGGSGGGSQDFWVGFRAGNGGRGGNGGEGGGGGGGCGGASFGFGIFGKPAAVSIDLSANDFVLPDGVATGGIGGAGGLSGQPRAGARGVDGLAVNLLLR